MNFIHLTSRLLEDPPESLEDELAKHTLESAVHKFIVERGEVPLELMQIAMYGYERSSPKAQAQMRGVFTDELAARCMLLSRKVDRKHLERVLIPPGVCPLWDVAGIVDRISDDMITAAVVDSVREELSRCLEVVNLIRYPEPSLIDSFCSGFWLYRRLIERSCREFNVGDDLYITVGEISTPRRHVIERIATIALALRELNLPVLLLIEITNQLYPDPLRPTMFVLWEIFKLVKLYK